MSKSKSQPYSSLVDEKIARQLLNGTGHTVEVNGSTLLLGDALVMTSTQLRELVSKANQELKSNEIVDLVAKSLPDENGCCGEIVVSDSGIVQIYFDGDLSRKPTPKRKSKIPLMEDIKKRADKLGVTIPPEFGLKRSKIVEYLDKIEKKSVSVEKKNGDAKKSSPKKPPVLVQVVEDPVEDPGPMSAGPDETKMSSPLDEGDLPKKRGFVKTSEAISSPVVVSVEAVIAPPKPELPKPEPKPLKSSTEGAPRGQGRSMRQLVEDSKEVNITDLLASDLPK